MEKVLLFQVQDKEAAVIANMLAAMKVKCECVPESAFRQMIGALASGKTGGLGSQTMASGQTAAGRPQAETGQTAAGRPRAETGQTAADRSDGQPKEGVQKESLMVFCDVSEKHFNRTLALMRERAVKIDYKAVLTPTNREWNVLRLYAELAREKAEYERMKG